MATSRIFQPSNNPYASGAVAFDSSPVTQFFLNKQAREEANQNAFYKAFSDVGNNINAAGLHINDVSPLYEKKAAWQQYVMAHNKEYMNPSLDQGKVYGEANKLYNDAMGHISAAKGKVKNLADFSAILKDPEKAKLLNESYHDKYENAVRPVNDPLYEPLDAQGIYNEKPFDAVKYRMALTPFVKEAPGETSFENIPDKDPKNKEYLRKPITKMIQNYDKSQIAQIAENQYANDPTYRNFINKINTVEEYNNFNKVYKEAFGKDVDIKHTEEIAIAHTLSLLPKGYLKEGKPELDNVAWEKDKNARNFGQSKVKIALNKQNNEPADVIPTIFKGYQTGQTYEGKEGENIEVLNIPPIIGKKLSKESNPAFGLGKDGKIYEVQFQKDINGRLTKVPDWGKSKEVPQSELITEIQNHAVPSGLKAKTMLKTLGNKLGIGTPAAPKGAVQFEENGTIFNIPADKVDAFIKAKPKAKRK